MEVPDLSFPIFSEVSAGEIDQYFTENCVSKLYETKLKIVDRHNFYALDLHTTMWYAKQVLGRVKSLVGFKIYMSQMPRHAKSMEKLEHDLTNTIDVCLKLNEEYRKIIIWLDDMISLVRYIHLVNPALSSHIHALGNVQIGYQHPCESSALFSSRKNVHIVTARLNQIHELLRPFEDGKLPSYDELEECVRLLLTCFLHKPAE